MILALAGGVGGAKLARGLALVLPPQELVIAVNTGDDFEHLGVHISPDIDTVLYTLAGLHNPQTGWGLQGESWHFMQALSQLGEETWFQLGDRDLATHVARTRRLRRGEGLTAVTRHLARALGVTHPVVPMSDDPVRTTVHSDQGVLAFQDYFVRLRCEPKATRIEYRGAQQARVGPGLQEALENAALRAVVICPSNPLLSIAPILAIPGMRARLQARGVPIIAVSPIVAGRALKGPAAKLFAELDMEVSCLGVARYYQALVSTLIIDAADRDQADEIGQLGMHTVVTQTVMRLDADKMRLAHDVLGVLRAS